MSSPVLQLVLWPSCPLLLSQNHRKIIYTTLSRQVGTRRCDTKPSMVRCNPYRRCIWNHMRKQQEGNPYHSCSKLLEQTAQWCQVWLAPYFLRAYQVWRDLMKLRNKRRERQLGRILLLNLLWCNPNHRGCFKCTLLSYQCSSKPF